MEQEVPTVSEQLVLSLAGADVLTTFQALPIAQQLNFQRWIEKSIDDKSRHRRIDALVLAMRSGLLTVPDASPEALQA